MIGKAILDTDILSEYLKGHNATVTQRAADYVRNHGVFTFTSVTVYEIVYGLELKGASSQLKKVMALAEPERGSYAHCCRLSGSRWHQSGSTETRDCGRTSRLPNCLYCGAVNRPLVTGNTGDFQAIREIGINLVIENWR